MTSCNLNRIEEKHELVKLANYGSQIRNKIRPNLIIGNSRDREFIKGDILDANAVHELIEDTYNKHRIYRSFSKEGKEIRKDIEELQEKIENLENAANIDFNYLNGCNIITSISNVPTSKRLCIANISTTSKFDIDGILDAGRELHVIINNVSSSKIKITIPNTFKTDIDELEIESNRFGEINIISGGNNQLYLRAA